MIATVTQLRMARAALRLSQADVAERAGISKTAFNDLETGASSPRAATLSAIQCVLEREGAVFSPSGSVSILHKAAEKFIVEPRLNLSPDNIQLAIQIVNASRALKGMPPLTRSEEEDQ